MQSLNISLSNIIKELEWDGSLLLNFTNINILHKTEDPDTKLKYWTIYYNYKWYTCMIRTSDNPTPCIYDEAMAIFNKPKVGTHYVKKGSKYVILHKVKNDKNNIIHNEILINKSMNNDINIKKKVAALYIIRNVIGVSHTTDSDLSIRKSDKLCYPDIILAIKIYSIKEDIYDKHENTIPETALDKWFDNYEDIDVHSTVFNDINSNEDIERYTSMYRDKLIEIVKRVDNTFIYMIDLMVHRLYNILTRLL